MFHKKNWTLYEIVFMALHSVESGTSWTVRNWMTMQTAGTPPMLIDRWKDILERCKAIGQEFHKAGALIY